MFWQKHLTRDQCEGLRRFAEEPSGLLRIRPLKARS